MSTDEACANCDWREPDTRPEYKGNGQCRRYPPTMVWQPPVGEQAQGDWGQGWPYVDKNDWCGEFK